MLVAQDVAAHRLLEEVGVERPIEQDHELGARDERRRGDDEQGGREVRGRAAARQNVIPGARMVVIVTRKFNAVATDEAPAEAALPG